MEAAVHGTKGGYRILFKTPGAPSIGSDIRNNISSEAALGKSAYSIAFAATGCVFTKYIIIRDTLRSDATGFIAFSLFLLFNEELPNKGADVKSMLDELSNHYVGNYVRNNSINKGETSIIQEDWSFVNNILGRKTEQDKSRNNIEIQAGGKEAAFVFYEDDAKLQEYFSKPFQEEYNGYKQILLISGGLRNDSADLLNALRNSGVELKVDLKNEPFFLNNYNRSKGITIVANGKPRSEGKDNNVIRAKEKVEIKYEKDYYKPIEVTGTLSNPDSDIYKYKYLETRGNQIIIKYDALSNNLKPIEKTITFDIKDRNGNPVRDAEITCKSDYEPKTIINNPVTFRGEEIGQRWTISAKKGDNLFSAIKKIIPENESRVELVLNERKKVKFQGELKTENDSKYFPDIKISIREKNIDKSPNTEVEFINDEINKPFKVIATYSESNNHLSGEKEVYPKDKQDGTPVSIELKQQVSPPTSRIYLVDAGKHGTASAGYSYKEDGTDVTIKEKKGYIFTGFKLDKTKKKKNYEGTHVAQYKKKKPFYQNPKFIAGTIVGAIIIGFGLWALFSLSGKGQPEQPEEPKQPDVQHIMTYVKGGSLFLDTLNNYKKSLGAEQTEVLNILDSAIKKREFINNWNFDTLKKLHYYSAQQKFKTAIEKIDSAYYNDVQNRLDNVSSWSLDQIADSINAVLNPAKPTTENKPEDEKKEKKEEPKKEPTKPEPKREEKSISIPANTNNPKDITKELQSGAVTKDELQNWKTAGMEKYKKSIDLYLKFWDKVSSSQKDDFDKLLKDVKSDAILKNSELKNFLTSICESSDAFQKYNSASGKATCKTIAELKNKVK